MELAKPEWGIKRVCRACGVLYYDFHKEAPACPKCAVPFDPETVLKSRRARTPVPDEAKPEAAEADSTDEDAAGAEVAPEVADEVVDEAVDESGGADEDIAAPPLDDDDDDESAVIAEVAKEDKDD